MKYTKEQFKEALEDFGRFIKMTKDCPGGTPIRLFIVRDLIKKELENKYPDIAEKIIRLNTFAYQITNQNKGIKND